MSDLRMEGKDVDAKKGTILIKYNFLRCLLKTLLSTQFHRVFLVIFINFFMIIVCLLLYQTLEERSERRNERRNFRALFMFFSLALTLSSSSGDLSFSLTGYQNEFLKKKMFFLGLKINRFYSFTSLLAGCWIS